MNPRTSNSSPHYTDEQRSHASGSQRRDPVAYLALGKASSTDLANTLAEQLKEGLTKIVANNVIASIISSHVAKLHAYNEALATNLSSLEYTNDRITNLLDRSSLDTTTKTISSAAEAMTTGVSTLATKLDKLERVTVETTNFKTYSDAFANQRRPKLIEHGSNPSLTDRHHYNRKNSH